MRPIAKETRRPKRPTGKWAKNGLVGAHGLGPWTSSLSETRSNQLSYAPGLPFSLLLPLPGKRTAQCHTPYLVPLSREGTAPCKGGDPAAGSPTATLLRLHPSRWHLLGRLAAASVDAGFHDVTGGVYKARERIQGTVADVPLLAIPTSCSRVADCSPNWGRLWGSARRRRLASHCTGHCSTFAAPGVRAIRT